MTTQFKKLAATALLASAVSALALVGCSPTKTVEKEQYSGFLKDYSKLQLAKSSTGTPVMRWISPDLSAGNYDKIWLDQPVLFLGKDQQPTKQVSKETMEEVVAYLGTEQKTLLQRKLALASGPGPNTLRVRTAITAVRADTEGLKPYEVIPVALVFAAVSTASGSRDAATAVFVEGEVTDSQTGAMLVEFARKDAGPELENTDTKLTLKDVQPLLDKWVTEFYVTLKSYTKLP